MDKDLILTQCLNPDINKVLGKGSKLFETYMNNLGEMKIKDQKVSIENLIIAAYVQGYMRCGADVAELVLSRSGHEKI